MGLTLNLTLVAELFKLFQGFLLLLPCIAGLEQALAEHRLHCCLGPEQAYWFLLRWYLALSRPSCICAVLALCWPLLNIFAEIGLGTSIR